MSRVLSLLEHPYWRSSVPRRNLLGAYTLIVLVACIGFLRIEQSLDRIEGLREQRVADQGRTDRLICERQEDILVRLRETKGILLATNFTLRRLIVAVSSDPAPDPENGSDRSALRRAASELHSGERQLLRGIGRIDRLLEIDCARLPSEWPFRR